jgi:hypothetical protein
MWFVVLLLVPEMSGRFEFGYPTRTCPKFVQTRGFCFGMFKYSMVFLKSKFYVPVIRISRLPALRCFFNRLIQPVDYRCMERCINRLTCLTTPLSTINCKKLSTLKLVCYGQPSLKNIKYQGILSSP